MKRHVGIAVGLGAIASVAVVAPSWAGPDFKNKYGDTTVERDCGDGDTVTYAGPLKMWPPNHKLQDVAVTAEAGKAGEQVELTVGPEAVNQDEGSEVSDATGGDGGPNHDPDVFYPDGPMAQGQGSATVPMQLRSERSGRGDGRTYTLHWLAMFGSKECSSMDADQDPFVVTVPHDMRGGKDW